MEQKDGNIGSDMLTNNKNLLTLDDLEGITFNPSKATRGLYTEEDLASYAIKMAEVPQAPLAAPAQNNYDWMCSDLKNKADAAVPVLPQGTNEILNRIVNKLYDLAQDIKLSMSGY